MKAVVIHTYGGPEMLRYEDVADPTVGPFDVLIEVHAVSIQRVLDVSMRQGNQQQRGIRLPLVPGVDPSGVVVAVGEEVRGVQVGDRVAARHRIPCGECESCRGGKAGQCEKPKMLGIHRWGGDAELCAIHYTAALPIPDSLSFAEATVVCRHAPTAYNLLVHVAKLQKGETVLIMGAGGNLGSIGVQIAKNLIGATVIAGAGADSRVQAALDLGADVGVNYGARDLTEAVMEITKGRGVDVLYDNIANPKTCGKAIDCLADHGRMVTAGAHGGPVVPVNFFTVYDRGLTIRGATGARNEDYAPCFQAAGEGRIKVIYERVMPLSRTAEAHRLIEGDNNTGKIILDPTLG